MLKKFFHYVIPSMIAMLVFNLYTLVDGMFVANYVSEKALASISLASPYITATFAISVLFSVGTSIVMSIYRGENNLQQMNKTFTMNTIVLSVLAIIISLFGFFNAHHIATFLGANKELHENVTLYLRIISIFGFFYIVAYSFEVLLKADGYPQKSIQGVVLGAITNIVLDALFIIVFHMGLMGAALATGIAQMVTFLFFVHHFFFTEKSHFHFIKGKWNLKEYSRILPLGLSEGLNECSQGVMTLVFNYQIENIIGTSGLISFSVIIYIFSLVLMASSGISQGIVPLISFYHGKKDKVSINIIHKYARITITVVSVTAFILTWCFASNITKLFLSETSNEFLPTIQALRIYSLSFLFMGHTVISYGILSAVENARKSFILSISRGMIFVTITLYVLSNLFGASGIWFTPVVSEAICFIISILFIYQSRHKLHDTNS